MRQMHHTDLYHFCCRRKGSDQFGTCAAPTTKPDQNGSVEAAEFMTPMPVRTRISLIVWHNKYVFLRRPQPQPTTNHKIRQSVVTD
jgi:hypothetical protein